MYAENVVQTDEGMQTMWSRYDQAVEMQKAANDAGWMLDHGQFLFDLGDAPYCYVLQGLHVSMHDHNVNR